MNLSLQTAGRALLLVCLLIEASCAHNAVQKTSDSAEFLELEQIESAKALDWVEQQNQDTMKRLGSSSQFLEFQSEVLKILEAKDRIPSISIKTLAPGKVRVQSFWQDAQHVKGIFREQSLDEFKARSPRWTVLFDVDQIAKKEKRNWVFKGLQCAPKVESRCMLALSDGGSDAVLTREFDLVKRAFVKDGFEVPMGKVSVSWRNDNSLWVGTIDRPEAASKSGYPIEVRVWNRGESLSSAKILFSGKQDDVSVRATTLRSKWQGRETSVDLIDQSISFFESIRILVTSDENLALPFPRDAKIVGLVGRELLFTLRSAFDDVNGVKLMPNTLYSFDLDAWIKRGGKADFRELANTKLLFAANSRQAFQGATVTKDRVFVSYLEDVMGRIAELRQDPAGNWALSEPLIPLKAERKGAFSIASADYRESAVTFLYSDFVTPTELLISESSRNPISLLREMPPRFDSKGVIVEAKFAKSSDGEAVPYFLVKPSATKFKPPYPTLIYAYGGFEIPSTPNYLGATGKVWVERGGAYVLANIRGGGEFGPRWHQAARKTKRQRAFDDLYSVADDLIRSGVTRPSKLGVRGGSNGGLLTGVALTQRPDLFAAVLSQVPLLDMLRFHKLLAGNSWMDEYGNPDVPEERKALAAYSPLQNLKPNAKYPEPFFTTSTRDDRVHPGHARRMVAKMKALGYPVLYFENTDGGHAGAAQLKSRAKLMALEYRYLWSHLGDPVPVQTGY